MTDSEIRYTWIDDHLVKVAECRECPFYATECELGAECRYPRNPANNGAMFDWGMDGVRDDCPLKKNDEMTKLEPCPFCGSMELTIRDTLFNGNILLYVYCHDCGCQGGNGQTLKEAIELWNRRVKE